MENPNILLVDDDEDFLEAIKTALASNGFNVSTAVDGNEGFLKAKKLKPDLIILDVMLPIKDGYSVCHDLKNDHSTSHIPVLIVTSLGNTVDGKTGPELLAKGHNAEGYLEKPVEPQLLVETVTELIKNSRKKEKKQTKILLIDDDPDFIASVTIILENDGYKVKTSYTGEEGIVSARNENPDIVLLDVMLPGKDGYNVCKDLKDDDKTKSIPIIMLTSISQNITEPEYAKALAITHKADEYIEKPVEARELLKRIRKLIGPMRRVV